MQRASVTEAKNQLSALLDRVKQGESIVIVDRGVPVARLEPVARHGNDSDGRLRRLQRAGLVGPGTGTVPRRLIDEPPARIRRGASAVTLLLEERRTGR